MRVSIKWLKQYIDINMPASELARRLTLAGIEPKQVIYTGSWDNVVIGRIEAINRHPNADRLNLVTVDIGEIDKPTVVCGAPNVAVGAKIAFGKVGARIYDPHSGQLATLKPAKIRGIESSGMCLSEKELGISDNHEGILILPPEAPIGMSLNEYMGDTILDLEVTPNRPDCLSVIGIAREAAALTGQQIRLSEPVYEETGEPIQNKIDVEIQASDLCLRYCASLVTGVHIGESPAWMQERLMAAGQRPINNVVDITNYVMLEYGQPLHAFDYTALQGKKIIVRRAREGEKIMSLDGVERELTGDMLVIADSVRPVAIAGVMGGANSEVIEQTSMILLEAANFKASNIHYTSRTLRLSSESSMRFERGIRPELAIPALKRATQLLIEICGGQAARGIIDIYPGRQELNPITMPLSLIKRTLGIEFRKEQVLNVLVSLGFDCNFDQTHTAIIARAPYWRSDIKLPVDLVEEVARIIGYDKIPTVLPGDPIPPANPDPLVLLKQEVCQILVGFGFQNIVTQSLVGTDLVNKLLPEPDEDAYKTVRVANPMTAEQEFLRPTLRGNLIAAFASNRRFEENGIRLFEVSRIYSPRENRLPEEKENLCGIMGGRREDRSCHSGNDIIDFFDVKGVIEGLLEKLGVQASFEPSKDPGLHPIKQAEVIIGGTRIGVLGELHPKVARNFDINESVFLFEIDINTLMPLTLKERVYQPLPRFPAVVRDIALVVNREISHKQIAEILNGFSLIKKVEIFDIYTGEQVPPGKKSMAYRLTFQSPDRTLKDEEINGVMKGILNKLSKEVGAVLRA